MNSDRYPDERPISPPPTVSVVIPLFNEEENIDELYRQVTLHLESLGGDHELLLIDDGSRDATPARIDALAAGEAVIVMDGDLQDSPSLLPGFVERWREGFDVVYAVRVKRKEGLIKRLGYSLFYRVFRWVSDLDIPLDSGDFGLMDRRVVDALKCLPERMRFVRGLRTFVGFRQTGILCERAARNAGRPKYTFRALVRLAMDGIISFSSFPLTLVTYMGVAAAAVAGLVMVWVLADAFFNHTAPRGWLSTILAVLCMSSVQLLSLGIIGEYVRRIFVEIKARPTYIVQGPDRRIPARTTNVPPVRRSA